MKNNTVKKVVDFLERGATEFDKQFIDLRALAQELKAYEKGLIDKLDELITTVKQLNAQKSDLFKLNEELISLQRQFNALQEQVKDNDSSQKN